MSLHSSYTQTTSSEFYCETPSPTFALQHNQIKNHNHLKHNNWEVFQYFIIRFQK